MIKPCNKEKLRLKLKIYIIDQALEECLKLKEVRCQEPKSKTKSNVNRQNSFRVKT